MVFMAEVSNDGGCRCVVIMALIALRRRLVGHEVQHLAEKMEAKMLQQ
jgi:hypothetical protein